MVQLGRRQLQVIGIRDGDVDLAAGAGRTEPREWTTFILATAGHGGRCDGGLSVDLRPGMTAASAAGDQDRRR